MNRTVEILILTGAGNVLVDSPAVNSAEHFLVRAQQIVQKVLKHWSVGQVHSQVFRRSIYVQLLRIWYILRSSWYLTWKSNHLNPLWAVLNYEADKQSTELNWGSTIESNAQSFVFEVVCLFLCQFILCVLERMRNRQGMPMWFWGWVEENQIGWNIIGCWCVIGYSPACTIPQPSFVDRGWHNI